MSFERDFLVCPQGHRLHIKSGVILMVSDESYSSSFGEQWNRFANTQVDSLNGSHLTEDRFFSETGWTKESLAGATVLDAGCGSGRFSEITAKYAQQVISVDLSEAIFALPAHLADRRNILRIHGDLRELSLDFTKITHVFSIGVIQHTPKPYDTILKLLDSMSPGTKFAFTAYARRWYTPLHPKYLIRPVTRRVPRKKLLNQLEALVPKYFDILMKIVRPRRSRRLFKFLLPIALYPEFEGKMNRDTLMEFTILDTFDMLTPKYDKPLTSKKVAKLVEPMSINFRIISKVPLIVTGEKA
jgi:2-polyprenyl-3-methyl-5-hydroxy-6-metoxy-1,4-benzoquinol methylase